MLSFTPDLVLALLNGLTGAFSAAKGLMETRKPTATNAQNLTANPWLYVVGGLCTVCVGVLNWAYPLLGLLGTLFFVLASLYNAWFGAARKDWRFWTLNAYSIVASTLVLLSSQS